MIRPTAVLLTVWTVACGAEETATPESYEASGDSVSVVAFPGGTPRVSLSPTPSTLIGAGDDYLTRVYYARRREDGRVLLSMNLVELSVYDSSGRVVQEFGRDGDGPGEFGFVWDAHWIAADTVVALDITRRRFIRFFVPTGELVSEAELNSPFSNPNGVAPVGGGDHVGVQMHPDGKGGNLFLYDVSAGAPHTIAEVSYPDWDTSPTAEGQPSRWVTLKSGASRGGACFGALHTHALECFSLAGDRRAFIDLSPFATDPDASVWDKVLVAPDGSTWIRMPQAAVADSTSWLIVSADGRPEAHAILPESSRLMEVGDSTVTLLERDALDVETVAVRSYGSGG